MRRRDNERGRGKKWRGDMKRWLHNVSDRRGGRWDKTSQNGKEGDEVSSVRSHHTPADMALISGPRDERRVRRPAHTHSHAQGCRLGRTDLQCVYGTGTFFHSSFLAQGPTATGQAKLLRDMTTQSDMAGLCLYSAFIDLSRAFSQENTFWIVIISAFLLFLTSLNNKIREWMRAWARWWTKQPFTVFCERATFEVDLHVDPKL